MMDFIECGLGLGLRVNPNPNWAEAAALRDVIPKSLAASGNHGTHVAHEVRSQIGEHLTQISATPAPGTQPQEQWARKSDPLFPKFSPLIWLMPATGRWTGDEQTESIYHSPNPA